MFRRRKLFRIFLAQIVEAFLNGAEILVVRLHRPFLHGLHRIDAAVFEFAIAVCEERRMRVEHPSGLVPSHEDWSWPSHQPRAFSIASAISKALDATTSAQLVSSYL